MNDAVPPSFKLAWRTHLDWLNRKKVMLYSTKQSVKGLCNCIVSEIFLSNGQCIDQLWLNDGLTQVLDYSLLPDWMLERGSHLSFMIAKDHGPDSKEQLRIVPSDSNLGYENGIATPLHRFQWMMVVNGKPFPKITVKEADLSADTSSCLRILGCQEMEDHYEFKVCVQQVNNIKGKLSSIFYYRKS